MLLPAKPVKVHRAGRHLAHQAGQKNVLIRTVIWHVTWSDLSEPHSPTGMMSLLTTEKGQVK